MKKHTRRIHKKRAVLLLMTLTLATSCIVGATYAKFASSGTGGDVAVIAKFGVAIEANGQSFQTSYDANSPSQNEGRAVVKSVLSMGNVIAPGTCGDMIAMKISGKPEVSIKVNFEGQFAISNWEVIGKEGEREYYCPLTITVGQKEFFGRDYSTAKEFEDAVNQEIGSFSDIYPAELFAEQSIEEIVRVPSVSWRWDFEGEKIVDEYDTFLANRACERPENSGMSPEGMTDGAPNEKLAGVVLFISTSVEQID